MDTELEIKKLREEMDSLKNYTTIPWEIQEAFKARIGNNGLSTSSKGANTEDVTVNEAGSSSYAVMNDPDGFLQIEINGTVYYIPYFT